MRLAALALIVIVAALAFAGCGSKCGDLPGTVATVNGKPISCSDFVNKMTMATGHEILSNMIQQDIIMQWAEKEGVAPTDAQVERQIKLQKEAGTYDDQVKLLGEAGLKSELRNVQARINLAKKLTKITDQEVQMAYDMMKSTRFVHGPRKYLAIIVNPSKVKLQEAEKALKDRKNFEDVAQQYSDRRMSPRPPLNLWVSKNQQGMPDAVVKAAEKTKEGQMSGIVAFPGAYLIFKVMKTEGAIDKKLKDVRDEVVDTVAIQKSQSDPDLQRKLNTKLKAAKIEVNVERFKDLTKQFQNPPEPASATPAPR